MRVNERLIGSSLKLAMIMSCVIGVSANSASALNNPVGETYNFTISQGEYSKEIEEAILNDGTINFSGFYNKDTKEYNGYFDLYESVSGKGTLNVNDGATISAEDISISQSKININSGTIEYSGKNLDASIYIGQQGTLDATTNAIKQAIVNDGELSLEGGTLTQNVTGNGWITFYNNVTNKAKISQGYLAIEPDEGGTLTTNIDDIVLSSKIIQNGGKLILTGGTNNYTINNLTEVNGESVEGTGTTIIAGNVVNNGEINQALEIRSGSLTTSADNLKSDITNKASLTIGGTLSNNITGAGTTVIDKNLVLSKDTSIEGTLNFNNGTLNLSDKDANNYNIGTLNGNGNLALDVVISEGNVLTDTITSTTGGSGTITISDLNITGDLTEFEKQILIGSNSSLVLSDEIKNKYNSSSTTTNVTSTELKANVNWGDEFKSETVTTTITSEMSVVNNNTLKYVQETKSESVESKADALALINQTTNFGTEERTFTAGSADTNHVVSDNLGKTSAGTLSVIGQKDIDAEKISTIDFGNKYTGFELENETTINISDVRITNAKDVEGSVLNIANNKAVANLSDVVIDEVSANVIKNNGTVNFEGENKLNSGVSGNGITNITADATVELGENVSLTQSEIYVKEDGYLIAELAGKINAKLTIEENGLVDINASSITSEVKNDGDIALVGGILSQNITGKEGITSITGEVINKAVITQDILTIEGSENGSLTTNIDNLKLTNNEIQNGGKLILTGGTNNYTIVDNSEENETPVAGTTIIAGNVVNNGIINQALEIQSGKLTTSAENLKGDITNKSNLLIGGTLSSNITGGTTLINENLTLAENTKINGELNFNNGTLNLADSKTTDFTIDKLSGDGNLALDLDLSGDSVLSDTISMTSNNTGKVTIAELNITGDIKDFETEILKGSDSNIALVISDEVQNKYRKETNRVETVVKTDKVEANATWDKKFNIEKEVSSTLSEFSVINNGTLKYSTEDKTRQEFESIGDTLALINQSEDFTEKTFTAQSANEVYKVSDNLGKTAEGSISVIGISEGDKKSTIEGQGFSLFELDNKTELNMQNVKVTGANSVVTGSNKDAVVNLDTVEILNNKNGITTAGNINIKGNSTISNNGDGIKVTSDTSVITLDATGSEIKINDKLSGVVGSVLDINGGTVNLAKEVSGLDIVANGSNINLQQDNLFNGLNFTANENSTLNLANNTVGTMSLNSLTLNNNLNLGVDVDLANSSMDRISANTYNLNDYIVNISKMNMLSDAKQEVTTIQFADAQLRGSITTNIKEVAYSPIWKYAVEYNKDNGQFMFTRGAGNSAGNASAYNPAIMASPVAAQVGGYLTQLNSYDEAFRNMDMYMLLTKKQRLGMKLQNKYAISEGKPTYKGSIYSNNAGWFRPYATFEKVSLRHGSKVSNTAYGSFFGGESEMKDLGHGWDGMWGAYVGYNGSHQAYNGIGIYQNGGTLGAVGMAYKGNFFTGLTVNAGANAGEASTMYGHDNFTMLMAGIASKSGYNVELADGKFIIQPSLLMSYSFVNTFDYTNAAGYRINSDPLHAIQVEPGLKFIGNLKNGWQPYLGVSMVWNIMDKTQFAANNVSLPELSVKPYVKYGVGVRKTWGERFSGYLQAFFTNGGRNGIGLQMGFRWALGQDKKQTEKVNLPQGKTISSNSPQRTIIKQLTPEQKIANNRQKTKLTFFVEY